MQLLHAHHVDKAIAITMDHFARKLYTDGYRMSARYSSNSSYVNILYINNTGHYGGHI